MSIDGLQSTHDWFRKQGSFTTTLSKVECIKKAGIRSVIMTTISAKNIDEVPQIIDAVAKVGVDIYAFARYCPTSEDKNNGITPARYRELLKTCGQLPRLSSRSLSIPTPVFTIGEVQTLTLPRRVVDYIIAQARYLFVNGSSDSHSKI